MAELLHTTAVDVPARAGTQTRASAPPSAGEESFPLRLTGIVKRWKRNSPPVLDDLSFCAEPGTATWIGGANGTGKTTLLRIAAGAIHPTVGEVRLGSLDPRRDRREFQSKLAYLAAGDRALYARLSVRRHLMLWASLALLDRRTGRQAVEEALEAFELGELASRRADRLSLGQRQRVRLAGVFIHRPTIALLDEPDSSLDDSGLGMLADASRELLNRGGAVVWCSPQPDRAALAFDRRYSLIDGHLEAG